MLSRAEKIRKNAWLNKYPWLPNVLTIGYMLFALSIAGVIIFFPSIGKTTSGFLGIVSIILVAGPLFLTILQILNLRHTMASIPRLALFYLEIILMFGTIYFQAVSTDDSKKFKKNNVVVSSDVIKGINASWVERVINNNPDKWGTMGSALVCFQDSIHFSLITSTSVGYGDMVPISPMAKLLVDIQVIVSFFFIAFGVSFFFSNSNKSTWTALHDEINVLNQKLEELKNDKNNMDS